MKKIYFLGSILVILCLCLQTFCFALDWKTMHEKANNLPLEQAIAQANEEAGHIDSLYILAIAYFNNHDDTQAKEKFLRILGLDPSSLEARWGIAEFQRRIYKYDIAKDALTNIIQKNPDFFPAYISLAYIKYMETDFEEVVNLMGTVINQGLKNTDLTTHVRAHCLYAGGKGMLAYQGGPLSKVANGPAVFRHLKIAQQLDPTNVAVYFGFGCYYLLRPEGKGQDLNKAKGYLKHALQIDPLFADGYVRLSQVYTFQGDSAKAKKFLDKALEIDPDNLLAADIINKECKFICDWK
ncbi:MAG: tetratricopeptide repeat protein [Candidatus Omnitrophota bacterium]